MQILVVYMVGAGGVDRRREKEVGEGAHAQGLEPVGVDAGTAARPPQQHAVLQPKQGQVFGPGRGGPDA